MTVRDRILIHLTDRPAPETAHQVADVLTQAGLARAAGIEQRHVAQYVRPLMAAGLIVERTVHVEGSRQRKKAYFLTPTGKGEAGRLRGSGLSQSVVLEAPDGTRLTMTLGEATRGPLRHIPLLELLLAVEEEGYLRQAQWVEGGGEGRAPHVEMLSEAPSLVAFVGRSAELELVTREGDGPGVFVIRGVAGIGKSSFGARACEALRGRRNLFWKRVRPWDTTASVLGALAEFLTALGRPGLKSVLARGEGFRAMEVLRADLPGSRSLLIFDDAHEAAPDVLSLLSLLKDVVGKAPDVRALVLTRRVLPFYDRRDVVVEGTVQEIDLQGLRVEDMRVLLSTEGKGGDLIALGRKLGGHPLILALARSTHIEGPHHVLRDVRRFLEEEVYRGLSDGERRMMRAAALYSIPVPRDALFLNPSVTHDDLLSLVAKSLLRPVGTEAFEVHDTIREFFADTLTQSEGTELGRLAVHHLRALATEAFDQGNFTRCVDAISNALRLSVPSSDREVLWEFLGDAKGRLGHLPESLLAYREGVKETSEPETRARLHRKMARALVDRGELRQASQEIEAGFRALGDCESVERGWLHLMGVEEAMGVDWGEAKDQAAAVLETFRRFGSRLGQGEALIQLGWIELHSPEGDRQRAEEYFMEALEISRTMGDVQFSSSVHTRLSEMYSNHLGDVARAMEHIAAIESLTGADDALLEKARLALEFDADFPRAEALFKEVSSLGRRTYDAVGIALANSYLALGFYLQGRLAEAANRFEEVARDTVASDKLFWWSRAVWMLAECRLLQGDIQGFRNAAATLLRPEVLPRLEGKHVDALPVPLRITRAICQLLDGHTEEFRLLLQEASELAEEQFKVKETPLQSYAYLGPLYYGIALGVMGEGPRSTAHVRRAREVLKAYGLKARLGFLPTQEEGITKILQQVRAATPGGGTRPAEGQGQR